MVVCKGTQKDKFWDYVRGICIKREFWTVIVVEWNGEIRGGGGGERGGGLL